MKKLDKEYTEIEYYDFPGRTKFVEAFSDELLNTHDNLSYAVCGSWGVGKTFLIKRLEKILLDKSEMLRESTESDQDILFLYLDAWSMDHFESPLVAFIDIIMKNDKLEKQFNSDEFWRSVTINWNLGLSVFGLSVGIDAELEKRQILSQVRYSTILKERIQLTLSEYMKTKNVNKIVLVIDELDRCRPDFTIKLLEQYKHFAENFNRLIEIVYVIDDAQLLASLKAIYGSEYDVETYIHKIFDYVIRVPYINQEAFVHYCEKTLDLSKDYTLRHIVEFYEVTQLTFRDINRLKRYFDKINIAVFKQDIISESHPIRIKSLVLLSIMNLRNPVLVRSVLSYGESFDVLWRAIDELTLNKYNSDGDLKQTLLLLLNPTPQNDIDIIREIFYSI